MRHAAGVLCSLAVIAAGMAAQAAECPGNPDALGTSRTLVVDPVEHARLGTMQYRETLPLDDGEVVLTFDDGPLPPFSNRILDILASHCVKATYFMVGRMARAYPDVVRDTYRAGHTIGTHSHSHPLTFHIMPPAGAGREIDNGIAAVGAALGDVNSVAPFFRIPGLLRGPSVEQALAARDLMTWSADFPADDWRHIGAAEITRRALNRLKAKGKGILLLHDIKPATALALPVLLRELKARGYRVVHVVPATAARARTATRPEQWVRQSRPPHGWPRLADAGLRRIAVRYVTLHETQGRIGGFGPDAPHLPAATGAHFPAGDPAATARPHRAKSRLQIVKTVGEPGLLAIFAGFKLRGSTD